MRQDHSVKADLLAVVVRPSAFIWIGEAETCGVYASVDLCGGVDYNDAAYGRALAAALLGQRVRGNTNIGPDMLPLKTRLQALFFGADITLTSATCVDGVVKHVTIHSDALSTSICVSL